MLPKTTKTSVNSLNSLELSALDLRRDDLHELDYEDVALTGSGMRLVRQAATAVLRQFAGLTGEMSLSRCLALFLDHVFWEEKSGGLILCADFPGKSYCLPIPRDCWALLPHRGRLQ